MKFSQGFLKKVLSDVQPSVKLIENKRLGAGVYSIWDMIFEYKNKKYRASYSLKDKEPFFGVEGLQVECDEVTTGD